MPTASEPPQSALPTGPWEGRAAFADLVRLALQEAASQGWPLIVLSDPDFADWPLGERGVVEALQAWAQSGRQLRFLAKDYRVLREGAPRLVQWRMQWDHLVQARRSQGAVSEGLPSAIWTANWTLERLDMERCRGVATGETRRRVELRERLDASWSASALGFPASILGL